MESVQVESAQMESESTAHDQQPPSLPQQNQESQESTSQWRSWQRIRSCFSVSVSLSSASWRRSQDQEMSQEEESRRQSHQFDCKHQESCHMSCSTHSSAVSSYSCSILFIHQINHLFRTSVLSPLSLQLSQSLSEISSRLIRVIAVTFTCLLQADHLSDHVNGVSTQGSSGCLSGVSSANSSFKKT